MQIFQQEYDDGVADAISANASVIYASHIELCDNKNNNKYLKAIAAVNDSDLYYTQSILVSTSWNKNDDIFDKVEVWKAKNSPEDKPTNLEHDESNIVGHIIANWPITTEGILIDEDTPVENLPEKFDILTASVIYKSYTTPELKERTDKLIAEIENGTKFVSMECFFTGFDYGLIDAKSGNYKVLSRNNDTAYLTKHLRAYGGTGEHEGYKIGRVLRNITFSGKGFVDRPANPDSIIFSKDSFKFVDTEENKLTKNEDFSKSGVINFQSNTNNSENQIMSDTTNTTESVDCTQAQEEVRAAAEASMDQLKTQLTSEFDAAIATVKAELETAKTELETLTQASTETQNKLEATIADLESKLVAANDSIAAYMKQEKKMMRKATLLEEGFASEQVEHILEKFDSLDDETFAAMTDMLKEKKMKKEEKAMKMKAEDTTENVDIEAALENVEESTEPVVTVGGEDDSEVETTRAALVDFVRTRLSK